MTSLYVFNLSPDTTDDDLRAVFSYFGDVLNAHVATDRMTGLSRGYGFVEMGGSGAKAARALNGTQFHGHALTVYEVQPHGP